MEDTTIGSVSLHGSVTLVFTLSRWKGRPYAQVRKFVATGK